MASWPQAPECPGVSGSAPRDPALPGSRSTCGHCLPSAPWGCLFCYFFCQLVSWGLGVTGLHWGPTVASPSPFGRELKPQSTLGDSP